MGSALSDACCANPHREDPGVKKTSDLLANAEACVRIPKWDGGTWVYLPHHRPLAVTREGDKIVLESTELTHLLYPSSTATDDLRKCPGGLPIEAELQQHDSKRVLAQGVGTIRSLYQFRPRKPRGGPAGTNDKRDVVALDPNERETIWFKELGGGENDEDKGNVCEVTLLFGGGASNASDRASPSSPSSSSLSFGGVLRFPLVLTPKTGGQEEDEKRHRVEPGQHAKAAAAVRRASSMGLGPGGRPAI